MLFAFRTCKSGGFLFLILCHLSSSKVLCRISASAYMSFILMYWYFHDSSQKREGGREFVRKKKKEDEII